MEIMPAPSNTVAIERKNQREGGALMNDNPNPRVLVVDDDSTTRILVYQMLKSLGCDATTARNGIEALSCLAEDGEYICVLTDIDMPYIDGWEFARHAKALKPLLPIIALTGQDPNSVIPRLDSQSISHALFKPLRLDTITGVLDCFTQGEETVCIQPAAAALQRT
jgi:two-component system capsular synthesis sensor histidine kinase RcsC